MFLVFATAGFLAAAAPLFAAGATPAEHGHGVTAAVATFAERVISAVGYPGVFFAMWAESMVLPVPSEAIMPFTGFLVADGAFSAPLVVVVSAAGSICGSLASYWIGAAGGAPFVRSIGKYVLLDQRDLEATERFFRRRGELTIVVSRFIPVVRHLISIPAGAARMSLPRFLVFTLIGAAIWNTVLMIAGYYLRDHWDALMQYSHTIDLVVAALIGLLVVLYIYRHVRRIIVDRRAR